MVIIDPEFSALIPPLSPDEKAQLEANLVAEGCLDALKVWAGHNILLDGHNRLEICQRLGIDYQTTAIDLADREAACDWIDRNQLGRRNLNEQQYLYFVSRVYRRLKKAEGFQKAGPGRGKTLPQNEAVFSERTSQAVGRQFNMSHAKVERSVPFGEMIDASPDLKAALVAGENVKKVIKETKKREAERALVTAQANVSETARRSLAAVCDIRHCDMATLLGSGIKPDCIITDPPYPKEFLPLYGQLARLAKNVPLVAVMCGQSYLPTIMAAMTEHLDYRWTLAYLTPGGQAVQQWSAKVNTFWKPVLLFGKSAEWFGDVARSEVNDNDKRFHNWGQSESGMADLVDRLSKPGQLICDPFVGGGATAVAALKLGRRFVGCDIDEGSVKKSIARCEVIYVKE